mgnify:CR=1 FL=1|jgi:hypothetical protein
MIIDKDTFLKWQERIICEYYTDKHLKTELHPKKNKKAVLKQSKTIIALDFDKLSSNVDKGKKKELPEKHKISLFHIGKMKDDLVSLGYEDDVFSYPGLDFGGLTNYKQKLGTKNEFQSKHFTLEKSTDVTKNLDKIYNTWKKYNKKDKLYGNMKVKMNKFLRSAVMFLDSSNYTKMYVRFIKLPEVHRVLVASSDIKKLTGNYYERIFKGDKEFAKTSSGKDLFCAIQKGLSTVNTNINKFNLLNEYTTY